MEAVLCLATGQTVNLPSQASNGLAVLIRWCPQPRLHTHAILGQQRRVYAVGLAVLQLDVGEVLGALGVDHRHRQTCLSQSHRQIEVIHASCFHDDALRLTLLHRRHQ